MKNKNEFSNLIHETEKLVSAGLLVVDSIKRQLILVESFWKKMDKAGQDNFIKNMAVYCNLKNAYTGSDVKEMPKLRLVVKNEAKIISMYELHKGEVKFINY